VIRPVVGQASGMNVRAIHVVPAIDEEASGPSYSVPSLCRALVASGVEVHMHVLARGVPALWQDLSIHQHAEYPGIFRRIGVSPAMRKALRLAAQESPSIVHNHSLWMMPNVYPGFAVTGTRSRLVTSPRGVLDPWALRRSRWRKRIMMTLVQRRTLERTDCFHATSDAEYRDVRDAGWRAPVAIIPNGVDIPVLPPRIASSSRKLIFLGRLHPKKGVDILLQSWSVVAGRFPQWELLIVGPDEAGYGREMERLAATLGAPRVVFRGSVYGETKWRELAASSLFVLPTHAENFGLAVAEALACGVPAIVTRGAPWQGLKREGCGWWIDHGAPQLIECLESALARSEVELSAMGLRGRDWMRREFAWPRIGDMMALTYRWILEGGVAPEWIRLD
jgi:glycosyltransferase involved in cell wall biosynthesis